MIASTLAYHAISLAIFSYAIFWMDKNPWWFALMILLDLLFNSYAKTRLGTGETQAKDGT